MNHHSLFDGENVVLNAIEPEKDAETYSRWSLDEDMSRNLLDNAFRPQTAFSMKKKLKEDLKKAEERRNQYFFGIREKGKDDLIGVLSFHWVQTSSQVGHLRMNFGEKDHAKEYAQEVLALALRYAFMELSLHRVTAQTQGHREDEIKLLEQAGFLRESQRRQAVFQDGKYRDELVYGLLRNEWKERNKEVQA